MDFSIFIPEGASLNKLPVVYFLAGLTCNDETFMTKAGAQKYAAAMNLILVAPDTSPRGLAIEGIRDSWDFGEGAGFYVDATQPEWARNFRMYEYVSMELPKLIEAEFKVDPHKKSVMGHSMGGHGALVVGLRNATEFKCVSAFAPILSPSTCPWGIKAFANYLGEDKTTWQKYDASILVTLKSQAIPILIDQGDADGFLKEQLNPKLFLAAAASSNFPVEYRSQPGYDHSYYFISTFIEEHLKFHLKHLVD